MASTSQEQQTKTEEEISPSSSSDDWQVTTKDKLPLQTPSRNWFSLVMTKQTVATGPAYYSYEKFVDGLPKQLERSLESLKNSFYLNGVEIILEKARFASFTERYLSMKNDFLPFLTFHSTQNMTKVDRILKDGYLIPGMNHPTFEWTLRMQNGNVYGDGIYSSSSFEVSKWHSFFDGKSDFLLLVNLVASGHTKRVVAGHRYPVKKKGKFVYEGVIPDLNIDSGTFADPTGTYQTLQGDNTNIWVSSSPESIIPVALVKLGPNINSPGLKQYLSHSRKGGYLDLTDRVRWTPPHSTEYIIRKYWIGQGHWLIDTKPIHREKVEEIDFSVEEDAKESSKVLDQMKHLFLCPASHLLNKLFAETVNNFANSLDYGKVFLLPYGGESEQEEVLPLQKKDALQSHVDRLSREKRLGSGSALRSSGKLRNSASASQTFETICDPLSQASDWITKEHDNDAHVYIVYVFIGNPMDLEALPRVIEKWKLYLKMKLVVFKMIFLRKVHPELLRLKCELQTLVPVESYWYEASFKTLGDTCDVLLDEIHNIQMSHGILTDAKIPFPHGVIGEGFLPSLDGLPVWDATIPRFVLFQGDVPKWLKSDEMCYIVKGGHTQIPLNRYCNLLLSVLARFRNFVFKYPERCRAHLQLITHLAGSLLNFLKEVEGLTEKMTMPLSLIRTSRMHLQRLLSDISAFGKVKFDGRWYDELMKMRFSKKILKRTKEGFTLEDVKPHISRSAFSTISEPSDALAFSNRTGYYLRLKPSDVAAVQPWNLIIDLVSQDQGEVRTAYRSTETGSRLEDSRGYRVTDVLPHDVQTPLDRMALAYAFTRVPYLSIPGQLSAAVVISFCRCIEQAFRTVFDEGSSKTPHDQEYVKQMLVQAHAMLPRVKMLAEKMDEVKQVLNKILLEDNFEKLLTTKHIVSLLQILAVLSLPSSKDFFSSSKWSRFCFAMLVEGTSRACRARLKTASQSTDELLRTSLGLKFNTNLSQWKMNKKRLEKVSSKFFFHPFTNCSPFAVVGVLHFIEQMQKGASPEEIATLFSKKSLSMRSFLETHLPGHNGRQVQVAMYLFGIRYCREGEEVGQFRSVEKIIQQIVEEQTEKVASHQRYQLKLQQERSVRRRKRLEKAQIFQSYHKIPKIFTEREVAELNLLRPQTDQLVRTQSGLLVHHCCYPDCPDYLKNFATKEDLQSEKKPGSKQRRNGLMNHLQYDELNRHRIPHFHLSVMMFRKLPFPQFLEKMEGDIKSGYQNIKIEKDARGAWEQHQRLLKK